MSPAAVDWEVASSWPTRRSLASGADDCKDGCEDVEATANAPAATALNLAQSPDLAPSNRARSTSPGRGATVPPPISAEAKGSQAEHAVGAPVLYWSGTHGQWMDAVVTKHNFDSRGNLLSYDLDVKRGAQAAKIKKPSHASDLRPLPEQGPQPMIPPAMLQKVPTPISNTATGLGDLTEQTSTNNPLPTGPLPTTLALPPSLIPPRLAAPLSGAGTPGGAIGQSNAPGSAVSDRLAPPPEDISKDASLALRRFEVGEKVEYWSGTYSQWMQAKVERVRTDQVTYDLDVKRGAQRRKMRSLKRTEQVPTQAASEANSGPPLVATPTRAKAASSTSPARSTAASRSGGGGGTNGLLGGVTNESISMPARSSGRESVTSSRLRGVSRETVATNDGDEVSPTPKLSAAPPSVASGPGYSRSGSPFIGDKQSAPHEKSSPSGASQTAPVGDLGPLPEGRPRLHSGGAMSVSKGRHDLGRPGPVTSGSVGLAAGGGGGLVVTAGSLTPSGLLAGPKVGGQPRRLLQDSSGGPTIGTRPDSSAGSATSAAASPASATGLRSGLQAGATGLVTVNGVMRKVGPNGSYVSGTATGSEKMVAQRDGDKVVVRQLPSTANSGTFGGTSPSASSNRPPPSSVLDTTSAAPLPSASPPARAPEEAPRRDGGSGAELDGQLSPASIPPRTAPLGTAPLELPPPPPVPERSRAAVGSAGAASGGGGSCSSTLMATGLSGASVLQRPELEVGELDIGSGAFDPTQPEMHQTLASMLGYSSDSVIEEMTGFRGGLNEGVWFLCDERQQPPVRDLVLKLVKCTRISASILTEAENFVKMFAEYPKIVKDPAVAFPVRIFKCLGPGPERQHRYDLIVMWKVKGERLAELIAHKWYQKQLEPLWQILSRLGQTLAAFHFRYNENQHGDFQPSNVFYDEDTGELALIDIGGMGVQSSESDIEHFGKSLKLLADVYGSQILLEGLRAFQAGYDESIRARCWTSDGQLRSDDKASS